MPKLSSPAPSVPPCLGPDSARVWARLRNYVRNAGRRTLLVIRHDSPRLPRELPPLLAEESRRTLITATVSDEQPDPMSAALHAAPGGEFPAGCILSITGAEDLAITAEGDSKVALYEFARRLDLRRDQFLPAGGIVLVWATERVFDALAEHSLNFISRAAAVLTLAAAGESAQATTHTTPSPSIGGTYRLPPLPADAPVELLESLAAFEDLAVADELYRQGGPKVAHALAAYDAARDRIEEGWQDATRLAKLDVVEAEADPVRDFARALVAAYPSAGAYILDLRQHPREQIVWLESQLSAARLLKDRREEGNALGNIGLAHAALGDARKAIEFYEQQLVITREIGNRRGEGNALGNLGNAHTSLGEARKAIEYLEQAWTIMREIGDRRGEGNALGNLGNAHKSLGDARKAIKYHEQALPVFREIGYWRGEGNALWNSAVLHNSLGNRPEAIARAAAALAIFEAIEDPNAAQVRAALAEWRAT